MAHMITETDGLMLAGTKAWHGLGTVLPDRTDALTALQVARMNWEVEVCPITAKMSDGSLVDGGSQCVVVRKDTREVFAPCKAGYSPIQNGDIASLAYEISNQSERAVESAGSVRGGRNVWFLLDMGTIYAAQDDKIKPYLFIGAGHDLKMSLTIGSIATRVVCANTYAIALSEMGSDSIKIKHSTSATERMTKVKEWLVKPQASIKQYAESAVRMAETGISDEQLQAYFTSVWQRANGALTEYDIKNPNSRRSQNYLKEVSQWLRNFKTDPRQTDLSTSGTVWAAVNSVTQYSQHEQTVRNERKDSTLRTNSVLFGSAGDLNRAAYEAAEALIA